MREQRYALSRDEEEEGLSGIATGIRGPADELLGVLSVGGPTQRLDRQRGRHAVDHLLRAAAQIEAALRRGNRRPGSRGDRPRRQLRPRSLPRCSAMP